MPASLRRFFEAAHDFENVIRQFSAGAMRALLRNGARHVGDADAAPDFVAVRQWHLHPIFLTIAAQLDRPMKHVWVRRAERAFCAMDFEARQVVPAQHVEAHNDRSHRAVREIEYAGRMCWHVDGDLFPGERLAADSAHWETGPR